MAPFREYLCNYCGHQFEELVYSTDPEEYRKQECRCGSEAELLPALIGGYQGNIGGSSTRPKNSTSMKKAKVFTGNTPKPEERLEFKFDKQEKKED